MNLKPALSSSLCVKAVGSSMNVWTHCCCILFKKLIRWIYPLMLWVEDRDLSEHSQWKDSRAASAAVWLLIHTGMCVPESPCVNTEVKSCSAKLHQHDLFDLQTTQTINDFFFSLPPTLPCSLILLSCQSSRSFSSFLFSPLIFFAVFSPLSLLPTFLSPFAFSPVILPLASTCDFFYIVHLSPSWSTSSHPPSLSLPLPSLSASLAGCSLQWVSIMEAGSGAAAAVGSAALGLLGATATSSHDILDR